MPKNPAGGMQVNGQVVSDTTELQDRTVPPPNSRSRRSGAAKRLGFPVSSASRRGWWLAAIVLSLVGAGCAREPTRCAICYMPVPRETRAEIRVEGESPRVVCDPRCPLTFQQQTKRRVALLRVTDFHSGALLDPRTAFFVTGSDTAPDAHTQAVRTEPSSAAYLHWHRCLPSVLAFSTREEAQRFQRSHGGAVVSFTDLGFTGGDEKNSRSRVTGEQRAPGSATH